MKKKSKAKKSRTKQQLKAEPISLAPLRTEDALKALLVVKPEKRRKSAGIGGEKADSDSV